MRFHFFSFCLRCHSHTSNAAVIVARNQKTICTDIIFMFMSFSILYFPCQSLNSHVPLMKVRSLYIHIYMFFSLIPLIPSRLNSFSIPLCLLPLSILPTFVFVYIDFICAYTCMYPSLSIILCDMLFTSQM